MKTVELTFEIQESKEQKQFIADILTAQLSEDGYTGFLDFPGGIKAYIPINLFHNDQIENLPALSMFPGKIFIHKNTVEDTDWNAKWEKSFKPVVIDNQCLIHASFHEVQKNYKYSICITPKMSFGTGHHYTTSLMIKELMNYDLEGKLIVDMGCGTGILAILAAKMKAKEIWAIDIDEWAYKNTLENIELNKQYQIKAIMGDADSLPAKTFDYFLANINRNILLKDIPKYNQHLNKGGKLIVSGFYTEDFHKIEETAIQNGLSIQQTIEDNNWVAATFIK